MNYFRYIFSSKSFIIVCIALQVNFALAYESKAADFLETIRSKRDTQNGITTITFNAVGWFLRQHKFKDVDRRVYDQPQPSLNGLRSGFPNPPLLDTEYPMGIRQACESSPEECMTFVEAAAIPEFNGQSQFATDLERFQYRTAASYYLCHYSLLEYKLFEFFGDTCAMGEWIDFRSADTQPFQCALYSFCPDPCCGSMDTTGMEQVTNLDCFGYKDNPCRSIANGECKLDLKKNRYFPDMIHNELNYTCNCEADRPGFRWNHQLRECLDVDECYENTYHCPDGTVCMNDVGSYYCVCAKGAVKSPESGTCVPRTDLDEYLDDVVNIAVREDTKKEEDQLTSKIGNLGSDAMGLGARLWDKFLKMIGLRGGASTVHSSKMWIGILCLPWVLS